MQEIWLNDEVSDGMSLAETVYSIPREGESQSVLHAEPLRGRGREGGRQREGGGLPNITRKEGGWESRWGGRRGKGRERKRKRESGRGV